MAFGPVLALRVLGNGQFRELFLATGTIAVGALALALLVRYPAIRDPSARLALGSVLERRVGWVSLTALFYAVGYGAVVTFITLYATELGIQQAGLFFSVFAAGLVLTRSFSGRVFDRYGPRWVVGAGLGVNVVAYLLLAMWRVEAGYLSSAFLLGLGQGVATPSLQTMAVNLVPAERRGAANGTLFSAFDMGIGFGSYALGALGQSSGSYGTMYFAAAGAVLIAALLFFGFVMPRYRPEHNADDQSPDTRPV
jgi:predicted MFS family arabinose efflux permease